MIVGRVTVSMASPVQVMKRLGVDGRGDVQRFHTANVIRRIQKYMPYRTGAMIKLMIAQSPVSMPRININAPGARYLYYGKAMEGTAPKTVTDRDLVYSRHKNALAGSFWDRRLKAAEMPIMQRETQAYINQRGRG